VADFDEFPHPGNFLSRVFRGFPCVRGRICRAVEHFRALRPHQPAPWLGIRVWKRRKS